MLYIGEPLALIVPSRTARYTGGDSHLGESRPRRRERPDLSDGAGVSSRFSYVAPPNEGFEACALTRHPDGLEYPERPYDPDFRQAAQTLTGSSNGLLFDVA